MNERILELKQQAEAYVDSVDDGLGIERYRPSVDLKFAELIVRECAVYIDAFNKENMVEEGIGGTELKQHFGVKE